MILLILLAIIVVAASLGYCIAQYLALDDISDTP